MSHTEGDKIRIYRAVERLIVGFNISLFRIIHQGPVSGLYVRGVIICDLPVSIRLCVANAVRSRTTGVFVGWKPKVNRP